MSFQSLRIAYRNIIRQRKRTLLLGGAIGFGFMIAVLINSFTAGFVESVEINFSSMFGGHIYVSGSEVSDRGSAISIMRDSDAAFGAMEVISEDIEKYTLRSNANASLIFISNEVNQSLVGVEYSEEPDFLDSFTYVAGSAETVIANPDSIIISEEIQDDLGVELGESIIVKTDTVNGQQNTGELIVSAVVQDQNSFVQSYGYVNRSALNGLLNMEPDQFQTINIFLHDLSSLDRVFDEFYQELQLLGVVEPREEERQGMRDSLRSMMFGGGSSVDEDEQWEGTKYTATNLNDLMDTITELVVILDTIGLGIFLTILVIIMVGIMNSYRMVMIERMSEIGTMRAIGVQRNGIRRIFQYEALLIALIGSLAGLLCAGGIIAAASAFSFGSSDFAATFLLEGHLNFNLSVGTTARNLIIVCLMSLISVYLPARAASRMEPAQALRETY